MAVKVTRLEAVVASKEAQLREWGASGRAWLSDAKRLRHAVTSTLQVIGKRFSLKRAKVLTSRAPSSVCTHARARAHTYTRARARARACTIQSP